LPTPLQRRAAHAEPSRCSRWDRKRRSRRRNIRDREWTQDLHCAATDDELAAGPQGGTQGALRGPGANILQDADGTWAQLLSSRRPRYFPAPFRGGTPVSMSAGMARPGQVDGEARRPWLAGLGGGWLLINLAPVDAPLARASARKKSIRDRGSRRGPVRFTAGRGVVGEIPGRPVSSIRYRRERLSTVRPHRFSPRKAVPAPCLRQ